MTNELIDVYGLRLLLIDWSKVLQCRSMGYAQ